MSSYSSKATTATASRTEWLISTSLLPSAASMSDAASGGQACGRVVILAVARRQPVKSPPELRRLLHPQNAVIQLVLLFHASRGHGDTQECDRYGRNDRGPPDDDGGEAGPQRRRVAVGAVIAGPLGRGRGWRRVFAIGLTSDVRRSRRLRWGFFGAGDGRNSRPWCGAGVRAARRVAFGASVSAQRRRRRQRGGVQRRIVQQHRRARRLRRRGRLHKGTSR
mmetsp:Transcript_79753/g.221988  ORF Transcript_79753/g.221988 Transcript_79753/m.221988 type:complete len:222 (+) Transcript_79753:113-778(+)